MSLNGYGSKIWKVSRCRPTVSNKTILPTKQEFFFTKAASVQSITDILLLDFWLILLPWIFISSYTTICFFVKNFFFECLYFTEYDILMFLFVFWLRNSPSTHVCKGVIQSVYMCVQEEEGGTMGWKIGHKICTY